MIYFLTVFERKHTVFNAQWILICMHYNPSFHLKMFVQIVHNVQFCA